MTGAGAHLGDLLSGLLDGELPAADAAAAHQHLVVCPACSREYDDVRTVRSWVRALPPAEPPAGFYEHILRDEPSRGRPVFGAPSLRRKVMGFAASAAAAVALVSLAAPRQSPVSPSVNRMVEAHATGASLSGDPLSRLAPLGVPVSFRK